MAKNKQSFNTTLVVGGFVAAVAAIIISLLLSSTSSLLTHGADTAVYLGLYYYIFSTEKNTQRRGLLSAVALVLSYPVLLVLEIISAMFGIGSFFASVLPWGTNSIYWICLFALAFIVAGRLASIVTNNLFPAKKKKK